VRLRHDHLLLVIGHDVGHQPEPNTSPAKALHIDRVLARAGVRCDVHEKVFAICEKW